MSRLSCFMVLPHQQAGALSRLFGRRNKENCFTEIHNLLARRDLSDLAAADVETVLSNYEVSRPQAASRLSEMYRTAIRFLVRDGRLDDADRAAVRQLRYVLGLNDPDAEAAEKDVLREVYRGRLTKALRDGHLSDDEKSDLEATAASFGLDEPARAAIYKDEVMTVIQQAFNEAVSDQRLTEEEERRLTAMSANLGVEITHDADTERKVARFRLLAQIEAGNIPAIETPLILRRGETCHGVLESQLQEMRTVTKAIRYAGPSGRIRIMKGLSYRYGSVSVSRVTSEELKTIDTGKLYITNQRLLFNGAVKNRNIPYKKIVQFTAYADGLMIEKDSGRDQYFVGSGDMELLAVTLESCLRRSRES